MWDDVWVSPFNPLGIENGDTYMGGLGLLLIVVVLVIARLSHKRR